jgi:hypothetical protein
MAAIVPLAVGLAGSYLSHLLQPVQKIGQLDPLALKPLTGYGSPIAQPYGSVRINSCPMIWGLKLIQTIQTAPKGFGGNNRQYLYYMTAAFLIGGPISGIKRIWMNGVQVFDEDSKSNPYGGLSFFARLVQFQKGTLGYNDAYNVGNSNYYTDNHSKRFAQLSERFLGHPSQSISTTISSVEGTNIPNFQDKSYIVTNRYPLADFNGTGFPQVDVEVYGKFGPLPLIADIITDIFTTAGFDASKLDLSDIPGGLYTQGILYKRSGETYQDYIEEIERLFFLVSREEEDGTITFLQKNRPSVTLTVALTNLGARTEDNFNSGTLFKEKILHARELPSEVQITMSNLGNSYNTWTIYARNPVATGNNPLAIQTRMYSNPSETLGIANRLISEVSVQRNTYSGINLLPCWYNQLKLGDVITLNIGTRQLSLQLSKLILTENYIVQIEGNQYINSQYSTIYLYHVFVKYTNLTTYIAPSGYFYKPSIVYTRTNVPFVGSADNLQVVKGNGLNGPTWGVSGNNGTFIALMGPGNSGIFYPQGVAVDPSNFLSTLNTNLLNTNSSNHYPGQGGLNIDSATNLSIEMVVQFADPNISDANTYDIYNNNAYYGPSQVTHNKIPQTPPINYPPVIGTATLEILDIPLISDADPPFTLYFAVQAGTDFTTAQIFYSTDGGSTYKFAKNATNSNAVGALVGTIPSGTASIVDTYNSFVVSSSQVINNCTTDQFLAAENLILVGDEIIAFRDVELLGDNQYQISYLIRGLRGTEWAMNTHKDGDLVVVLENLLKITASQSYINQTILYKLVPSGQDETDITTTVSFTYKAISVRPYSLVDISSLCDSTNKSFYISWIRRTYLNGGLRDYTDIGYAPGEIQQYHFDGELYANATALVGNHILTTESYNYTASQQLSDFGVLGIFSGVGETLQLSQASTYVGYGQIKKITLYFQQNPVLVYY